MTLFHRIAAFSTLAFALGCGAPITGGPANAMPPVHGVNVSTGAQAQIIKVGSRSKHRRRGHYGTYGYVPAQRHVHAPYTHVGTANGNVVVDAPYAYVTRSRGSVTVRAPYANIQIPR